MGHGDMAHSPEVAKGRGAEITVGRFGAAGVAGSCAGACAGTGEGSNAVTLGGEIGCAFTGGGRAFPVGALLPAGSAAGAPAATTEARGTASPCRRPPAGLVVGIRLVGGYTTCVVSAMTVRTNIPLSRILGRSLFFKKLWISKTSRVDYCQFATRS